MYYTFEEIKYYLCKNVLETDRYLTYHDVVGKLVDGPMPKLSNRDIATTTRSWGRCTNLKWKELYSQEQKFVSRHLS